MQIDVEWFGKNKNKPKRPDKAGSSVEFYFV